MGRRLYVGNLSYQVQESEIEQLFAQAGSVASVFVPRDKFTGQDVGARRFRRVFLRMFGRIAILRRGRPVGAFRHGSNMGRVR